MQHVIENNIWIEDIVDELVIENMRSFEENIVWRIGQINTFCWYKEMKA